jgi:glycine/sarcosine/betaine reductase selenoprotein B
MEHVHYIDKTHEYYRKLGYSKTYNYAHNDDIPFTPLGKPLAKCRVTIVSTAQFVTVDAAGNDLEPVRMMGTNEVEVFAIRSDWPAGRLRSTSEDHDRFQTQMKDIDAFFPITRLNEFVREGVLGSLSREFFRTLPNYSHRKTTEVDGPEILRRCREQQVDAALLCPV